MLYAGLMSGTSLDGIDAVLVDWPGGDERSMKVLGHVHQTYEVALRDELLALNQPGTDEIHRCAVAANGVALAYAATVQALLDRCGIDAAQVRAVGAHGQTVRHRPGGEPATRYTVQLINSAMLAEACSIDVVSDFRSRDMAAGGQGAPLVPAFHAARFAMPGVDQAILNLGGIGNLTLLAADGRVGGFDCGPGNALLDLWAQRNLGTPMDDGGRWAASGQVDAALLNDLLSEPFFALAPPKSTGRDLFNQAWLDARLRARPLAPQDMQATLAELTARSACDALKRHMPDVRLLSVCGGGAFNSHLMARLAGLLPLTTVRTTAQVGLPADQVEAVAFAWLARAFDRREAGNRPDVTGAAGPRILGALYPGGKSRLGA